MVFGPLSCSPDTPELTNVEPVAPPSSAISEARAFAAGVLGVPGKVQVPNNFTGRTGKCS